MWGDNLADIVSCDRHLVTLMTSLSVTSIAHRQIILTSGN